MFHFNKHFNHIITVIFTCVILSITPVFANAQPVVDSPANVKLQTIIDWLNNFLVYHFDYYNSAINSKLYDITQDILAVGGQVSDVSSKLLTSNNYLSSIDSNTDYVETHLSNIYNELNSINWSSNTYYQFNSILRSDKSTVVNQEVGFNDTSFYARFSALSNDGNFPSIIKLYIPVRPTGTQNYYNKISSIEFYLGSTKLDPNYYFIDNYNLNYLTLYIFNLPVSGLGDLYIKVNSSSSINWYRTITSGFYWLNNNSSDSIDLSNYIFLYKILNDIDKLTEIYASDDVIAAKENQQAYEDQAITDFTGSGSAAASGSDTTNMKNVSGAIKSGLDSGGSVNGALGVFNTSGGLWDWFSQSNYDEINGTQTRSRGSEEYIDFYNTNRKELERLLQEER